MSYRTRSQKLRDTDLESSGYGANTSYVTIMADDGDSQDDRISQECVLQTLQYELATAQATVDEKICEIDDLLCKISELEALDNTKNAIIAELNSTAKGFNNSVLHKDSGIQTNVPGSLDVAIQVDSRDLLGNGLAMLGGSDGSSVGRSRLVRRRSVTDRQFRSA